MAPSTSRRTRGLSLLECVAAIAVLGTAVVAGFTLFGIHSAVAASSRDSGEALRLLVREVERARAEPFTALASTAEVALTDAPSYFVTRTVTKTDYRADVTVTIRWVTPSGVERTESITTVCSAGLR